jgi:hypothetical protein
MARLMYGLLTTTPYRIPSNPGPVAIYYPSPVAIVDAQVLCSRKNPKRKMMTYKQSSPRWLR